MSEAGGEAVCWSGERWWTRMGTWRHVPNYEFMGDEIVLMVPES